MLNKRVKKLIASLILIVMFFPYSVCLAITQEEAGQKIADFAYNFASKNSSSVIYDDDSNDKIYGYNLKLRDSTVNLNGKEIEYSKKYPMDNESFVAMVIHQSLGISEGNDIISINNYINTESAASGDASQLKAGDIIKVDGEYKIYLGDDKTQKVVTMSEEDYKLVLNNKIDKNFTVYRIKEDAVKDIQEEHTTTTPNVSVAANNEASAAFGGSNSEFYYNGIPDGKYSVVANFWDIIVNSLDEIFQFLISVLTYIIRMVFVGWTAIVEQFITYVVESITGEPVLNMDATTSNTNENITIETIIYNKVKAFDINFFESN